jgi:hypothetical protein
MFSRLIVMLIESRIKKIKKNMRVFLLSIDYHEYFEVVSIIQFFSRFHIFCVTLHFQDKSKRLKIDQFFLKAFKINSLTICE